MPASLLVGFAGVTAFARTDRLTHGRGADVKNAVLPDPEDTPTPPFLADIDPGQGFGGSCPSPFETTRVLSAGECVSLRQRVISLQCG